MKTLIVGMTLALACASSALDAQAQAPTPPAIRQIGPLEHVSADSFRLKSVNIALGMPGGGVMINDLAGRRVLLLDSTFARASVPADTTGATANAYGSSWASLIRYHRDSALLMVPSTLSMFVLGPTGNTARVMAIPRPNEAQQLSLALGLDARDRLIYYAGGGLPGIMTLGPETPLWQDGK